MCRRYIGGQSRLKQRDREQARAHNDIKVGAVQVECSCDP
jgi:hypothetical protein